MLDRGAVGRAVGGPRHPHVTVPLPSNMAVSAPGQDKGGILPCPTTSLPGFTVETELAQGQPKDIQEEVLEELVELLGGGG